MANIVNFSEYGFLNDILPLNEENWRRFFKPIVYDSVQDGLIVSAGTGMKFNISAGECRCGSVMGVITNTVSLDADSGSTSNRIDSIVIQYTHNDPSALSLTIVKGTPSSNPVPPTLTKSYNSVWQVEIAQIFVPANATSASQCAITDKRIIYDSLNSIISPIADDLTSIASNKANMIADTSSGNPAVFYDGATNQPVENLIATIEPMQSTLSDPTPANPLPIIGWTELSVMKGKANLFGEPVKKYLQGNTETGFKLGSDGVHGVSFVASVKHNCKYTVMMPAHVSATKFRLVGSIYELTSTDDSTASQIINSDISTPTTKIYSFNSGSYNYITLGAVTSSGNYDATIKAYIFEEENFFGEPEKKYLTGNKNQGIGLGSDGVHGISFIGEVEHNKNYTISLLANNISNKFRIVLFRNYPTNVQTMEMDEIINQDIDASSNVDYNFNSSDYNYVVLTAGTSQVSFDESVSALLYETNTVETLNVSWESEAGIVYGGTLNLTKGLLTVTMASRTFTECLGMSNSIATPSVAARIIQNGKAPASNDTLPHIYGTYVKPTTWTDATTIEANQIAIASSGAVYVKIVTDPVMTSKEEYDTYLDANPLEVVYELSTPIVYHLTPQEITTILGDNTIASIGSVSVTYRADTKLYIDQKIAELEALVLENINNP